MGFGIEHHPVGCCDLSHLIFAEIEFPAGSDTVFVGSYGVHDLALLISDSAVRRDNILCGDDLIDRTGKSTLFILRLINGGQLLAAFIHAAADGNTKEHLAGLFHRDGAFLCHIGFLYFDHCNPAFLACIILRDIKVHGCIVQHIAIRSLHLDDGISLTKG